VFTARYGLNLYTGPQSLSAIPKFEKMQRPKFRRDSSVGIATRYGLQCPGIESRWGRDFLHPSRLALGPTQLPIQLVPGLFRGVKRPGRGVDHPPPSSAEVKEGVELYLYFVTCYKVNFYQRPKVLTTLMLQHTSKL